MAAKNKSTGAHNDGMSRTSLIIADVNRAIPKQTGETHQPGAHAHFRWCVIRSFGLQAGECMMRKMLAFVVAVVGGVVGSLLGYRHQGAS